MKYAVEIYVPGSQDTPPLQKIKADSAEEARIVAKKFLKDFEADRVTIYVKESEEKYYTYFEELPEPTITYSVHVTWRYPGESSIHWSFLSTKLLQYTQARNTAEAFFNIPNTDIIECRVYRYIGQAVTILNTFKKEDI